MCIPVAVDNPATSSSRSCPECLMINVDWCLRHDTRIATKCISWSPSILQCLKEPSRSVGTVHGGFDPPQSRGLACIDSFISWTPFFMSLIVFFEATRIPLRACMHFKNGCLFLHWHFSDMPVTFYYISSWFRLRRFSSCLSQMPHNLPALLIITILSL